MTEEFSSIELDKLRAIERLKHLNPQLMPLESIQIGSIVLASDYSAFELRRVELHRDQYLICSNGDRFDWNEATNRYEKDGMILFALGPSYGQASRQESIFRANKRQSIEIIDSLDPIDDARLIQVILHLLHAFTRSDPTG